MSRSSPLLGVALVAAFPAVGAAETQAEPSNRLSLRARAARRSTSVQLDGRLDEAAWADAPATRGFWQRFPDEGIAPSLDTEFRVLYDDDALYVGVRALDDNPEAIRGLLTRRDVMSPSDWIIVGLDSYHDRRTAFVFAINPAGVQRDLLIFDDVQEDPSWDAVWTAGTQVGSDGWTAEFRIPLSQLRFPAHDQQEWGLQVARVVARSGEESAWTPWPRSSPKTVSQFGTLNGIDGVKATRRMELLPYISGGAGLLEDTDAADPFDATAEMRGNIGVDVKYGLSSAFTLAATVNPDFGQVEADPSQVNLSGRELFFAEKRPFFLEGGDIFRYSLGQGDSAGIDALFYTRRIGAAPHVPASDDYDYTDEPDNTTIYGAAKISGKTSGGWSVGVLDAVTAEETAKYLDEDEQGTMVERTKSIEPLTNYAVARVRKDLRAGKTQIGAIATSVHRDLPDNLAEVLHDQAYTGGAEVQHQFGPEHTWSTNLRVAGSWVHGSKLAIEETQTKLRHLYQRPDADHIELDPDRTSLAGTALLFEIGKVDGGHWRFATGSDARSPGFEANDIGFHRNADYYTQWLWGQYRDDSPGGELASYAVNLNAWSVTDWSPQMLGVGGNINGNVTLKNQWGGGGGFLIDRPMWDPTALRGGANLRVDPAWNVWGHLRSDPKRTVSFASDAWLWRRGTGDSWSAGGSLGATIQARSNLDLFVGPSFEVRTEDAQYVDELTDESGDSQDPHYVFARIRQVVTGMTVRGSWTFSPTLSLQVYAQPFIAAGRYRDYKEASDPGAERYEDRFREYVGTEVAVDEASDEVRVDHDRDGMTDFSFDRPDFNLRELNSNVVLRWEYLPGSTVYFIWSHGRSEEVSDGRYQPWSDLSALGQATGEHVVMVKANYWIGL